MAMQDAIEQLRKFDVADLELNNIGSWPTLIKALVLVFVIVVVGGVGYMLHISDKRKELDRVALEEQSLRSDFEAKAADAANLDALRRQREEMEASFDELKRQLPADTEVPGLLEDITNTALESNLKIESVVLEAERRAEFYVELPITIKVQGTYHDLATFVSGVANLSRIVTLHDFTLTPDNSQDRLAMTILAKTYRYLDDGEVKAAAPGTPK